MKEGKLLIWTSSGDQQQIVSYATILKSKIGVFLLGQLKWRRGKRKVIPTPFTMQTAHN